MAGRTYGDINLVLLVRIHVCGVVGGMNSRDGTIQVLVGGFVLIVKCFEPGSRGSVWCCDAALTTIMRSGQRARMDREQTTVCQQQGSAIDKTRLLLPGDLAKTLFKVKR